MQDFEKGYLPMQHGIRFSKDQSSSIDVELERMN